MEIGIVGLPNVGKSTIFNVLTKAGAEVANYPFCTIEPNVGIVPVPDKRLDFLFNIFNDNTTKKTPATVKFFDIAGLVKGASKGEGLGNKFLGNIKQVDAIAHVVRTFFDENVIHSSGKIDPLMDIEIINTELMLADIDVINRNYNKLEKLARGKDKDAIKKLAAISKIKPVLEKGVMASSVELTKEEKNELREYNFLTLKPMLYVFNAGEDKMAEFDKEFPEIVKYVKDRNSEYVVISAKIETEIQELSGDERQEYIKELGFDYKGFDEFIFHAYHLLGLITFLTAGPQECRAWPIRKGIHADKAAGKIHTDMERGFIRAEVMKFNEFKENPDELKLKEQGKVRTEGKEYIVEDGDIMFFKFNV